jgi:hypothetical protein
MYQTESRFYATLVRLGTLSTAVAVVLLFLALYSTDLACGIFACFSFLCAACEFALASLVRPQSNRRSSADRLIPTATFSQSTVH